jgi:hypothetical protein
MMAGMGSRSPNFEMEKCSRDPVSLGQTASIRLLCPHLRFMLHLAQLS